MTDVFAYGSLVNADTHEWPGLPTIGAYLHGWRRRWGHRIETPHGKVCALTIERAPGGVVDGVLLDTSRHGPGSLDAREIGYRGEDVEVTVGVEPAVERRLALVYVGEGPPCRHHDEEYPIWRSYLDTVLVGYYHLGGEAALRRFVETTTGWSVPLLDDRKAPNYPRYDRPTRREAEAIAAALEYVLQAGG